MNRTNESDIVLSSISNLRKDYDEVLGLLRDEDNRQRNNTLLWIFKPFLRALFNYTPFMPKDKSTLLTKITSSSLLQHLGIIGIIFNNNNLINNLLWIAAIGFFIISVVINFKREVTIYDEYFDISAFRNLEKVIHTKLVSKYVESAPFTFNLLYDYIRDLIQNSSDHLAQMIKDNKEKEEENSDLRQELERAKVTVSSMRKSLNHQVNLQSHLNRTILRITEGTFDKDDLMIVCEFSLFKEEADKLTLDASHGLTRTPTELKIKELSDRQKDWAVIRAYLDEKEGVYDDESHNRKVVSKRFRMTDNTIYVYSFHYDSNRENDYGIIKTQEAIKTLYTLVSFWHSQHTISEEGKHDENRSIKKRN